MADLLLDNDKYKTLVALRTNLKMMSSPPALQDLCMDIYLSKASAIVSEWKKSGENIFDSLSNNLRTDLLDSLMSKVHRKKTKLDRLIREQLKTRIYDLTYMLMHHQIVKLRFYSSYSNSTSLRDLREFLTTVHHKCPKLEHFVANDGYERGGQRLVVWFESMMPWRSNGIYCLLQLVELRHLEINGLWFWTDDSLRKLFSQLKKLVFLKLVLHSNVTECGFRNIHLLKDLEEFHFVIDNPDRTDTNEYFIGCDDGDGRPFVANYERIYNYCADNLRSLKLIGTTVDDCLGDLGLHTTSDLRRISPKIQGTSMLEYLHTNSMLPEADFPNLRCLYFAGPISMNIETFYRKFSNFTQLTELSLLCLPSDNVAKILQLVGTQLKSLYVDTIDSTDLFQIFYFCPNLVSFVQHHAFDVEGNEPCSEYQALVTKHNVRLLEVCELVFYGKGSGGLFELVLFAPLLKYLALYDLSISRAECKLTYDMFEGCFQHLETFYLMYLDLDSTCSMDDVGLFMQCLVCSAPRLNECCPFWANDFLSDKWKVEQTVADAFVKLVRQI